MAIDSGGDWILKETAFDHEHLGKCEAIMCQGNGYMGLRAATEERYVGERRGLFVTGTFNKFDENEVCELPNAADVVGMDIRLDGANFSLLTGKILHYCRCLDFYTGELSRCVKWESPSGRLYQLEFLRAVSLVGLHTIAQEVTISPLSHDAKIEISTGINGQITNSGAQHFSEGPKRFYDRRYMQLVQTTTQSGIDFALTSDVSLSHEAEKRIAMDRRKIYCEFSVEVGKGENLVIEKISTVHTTRDRERAGMKTAQLQEIALAELKAQAARGYDEIKAESAKAWRDRVWDSVPVTVESENPAHQLGLRFAQYHLEIMGPRHDNRVNIAAKGMSGEGYKGHYFWDTEIFLLSYYIFSNPPTARNLEEYRHLSLPGARKKARENGYMGAQYPWEAAWLDDGEVCPLFGAADIVTGLPIPIVGGKIQIHITCDVCYGVWQYYMATSDEDFMQKCGYEIVFDAAIFWASRLEEGDDGLLHINCVMGPDEYKEKVDDDAFTNYFARWNLNLACEYHDKIKGTPLYGKLDGELKIAGYREAWQEKAARMYVPAARADGVIPQNRTFLGLKDADLTKYKSQSKVGTMFHDYNLEQINGIQVCKQADVLLLMLLMESEFTPAEKRANFNYYEPRTLHDSSLSLSTHSILANDMGEHALALALFDRAVNIDMGPAMNSSNDGIHAASIGGIWQCAVLGFGGLRLIGDKVRIAPKLPEAWKKLEYYAWVRGQKLRFAIKRDSLKIENLTKTAPARLCINGEDVEVADVLALDGDFGA